MTDKEIFDAVNSAGWNEVFCDPCTGDWQKQWFLDGEIGRVECDDAGMRLIAGLEFGNDAHHMVLWTKASFEGDLKIEFDYTRLDDETRGVNILYIQATGSGEAPYAKDIAEWTDLRRVPAMSMYFDHMNTYHLSFAAFPWDDSGPYIRGRRYMPDETGLEGTDLEPDYFPEGLFEPGVLHNITAIKKGCELLVCIRNSQQEYYCHMVNRHTPPVTEGRVGLRHMFTRSALYRNIRISQMNTAT